jgi:hypothetical protein
MRQNLEMPYPNGINSDKCEVIANLEEHYTLIEKA